MNEGRSPPPPPQSHREERGGGWRWRGRILAITVVALVLGAFVLSMRWSGSDHGSGSSRGNNVQVPVVLVPLLGVLALAMTPIFWFRDRRRDFLGEPARRPTYVALLVAGALWVATLPLGDLVMRESAEVSKGRALEVAAAAMAFHEATGRWPDSLDTLEKQEGRRLPRPTLRGYLFSQPTEPLTITFYSDTLFGQHYWQYDVTAQVWREYTD